MYGWSRHDQLGELRGWRRPDFTLRTHRPTGSKVTRASGHSSQVEHEQVALVQGAWNNGWIEEHQDFPTKGVPDDQVDSGADAFNFLTGRLTTAGAAEIFDALATAAPASSKKTASASTTASTSSSAPTQGCSA